MKKIITILFTVIAFQSFAQWDITKRKVTLDSLSARLDYVWVNDTAKFINPIYVNGNLFDGTSGAYTASGGVVLSGNDFRLGSGTLYGSTIIDGAFDFTFGNIGTELTNFGVVTSNQITMYAGLLGAGNNRSTINAAPTYLNLTSSNTSNDLIGINIAHTGIDITDNINSLGLAYLADYSAVGLLNDRWIPDVSAVREIAGDSAQSVSVNYGSDGEIAFMNTTGDSLRYNSQFKFDGTSLLYSTLTQNIFIGNTGSSNVNAARNIGIGDFALTNITTGDDNVAIGYSSWGQMSTGSENTAVGSRTGALNTGGSGNVYLGYNAGGLSMGSNELFIANSNTATPLIYGEFDNNRLEFNVDSTQNKGHFIVDSTLRTGNPKFYASFADSSEGISMTQNVYSHITGSVGNLFTVYRNRGYTYQNDSVRVDVPGWHKLEYYYSFQGTASDLFKIVFYVDNVEVANRAKRERSTTNNATGSCSGELNYYFSGGEWVKMMIVNTGDNDDATMVSGDWKMEFDE